MKKYAPQTEMRCRTLDIAARSAGQASMEEVLESYQNEISKKKENISQLSFPLQRVVDENVPMNSRIRIDSKAAPDYGDTGTIIRPSRVKPHCMAVEFDKEPGVLYRVYLHEMSVMNSEIEDLLYPQLTFISDPKSTERYKETVYDMTGRRLTNPAKVTVDGYEYYKVSEGDKLEYTEWLPILVGEDEELDIKLKMKLNQIARKFHGERCHEVAEKMQDEFTKNDYTSTVYEIYTDAAPQDGNHIWIMGAKVRNHYVNVLNERAYDSSTGGHGIPWPHSYIEKFQKENPDRTLKWKIATSND